MSVDSLFILEVSIMPIPQRLITRINDKDPAVKKLIKLSNRSINDKDVEILVNALKGQHWGKIDLSNNNFTNKGVELLASISVDELDMSQNNLSDEGARHLLNSKTIKMIVLDDNVISKQTLANKPYNNLKITPKILDILYPGEKDTTEFDLLEYEINNTAYLSTTSIFRTPKHNYNSHQPYISQQEQEELSQEQSEVNVLLKNLERDYKLTDLSKRQQDMFLKELKNLFCCIEPSQKSFKQ